MSGHGVIGMLGLENSHEGPALVVEDFGARSLDRHPLPLADDLKDFFHIALTVTGALIHIHQRQVIHKDINPTNIVWNAANGRIKLIDFGISSKFSTAPPATGQSPVLEGTLAYMSPEQTGRMNRTVDYRTDFYSLGVTFYHMLSGRLPFDTDDPRELVHCHIAQNPLPLEELRPSLPAPLVAIVKKLMAKEPGDRYQSAQGLLNDLETCRDGWNSRQVLDFPLGRQDIPIQFRIPDTVYGRQQALDTLAWTYERAARGSAELVVVAGTPGIGKTTLITESWQRDGGQKGYFLSGKFDAFSRNVPYRAPIQALKFLIHQWLTEDDRTIAHFRERLREALYPHGRIITDLIPEMQLIIGEQPPLPELPPDETRNRFHLVFHNLFKSIASAEHPLTIFLDDMQWSDPASREWISSILMPPAVSHIFIILAYRSDEVDDAHPLARALEKIALEGVAYQTIHLNPLSLDAINQLVADTLRRPLEETRALAALCLEKTGGNPFFLKQFLHAASERRWVWFRNDRWQWRFQEMQHSSISVNMANLLAGRFQQLPSKTQHLLALAACLGHTFGASALALVCAAEMDSVIEQLKNGVQARLIQHAAESGGIITAQDSSDTIYGFVHDKVRQAAYACIDEGDRDQVHLDIGRKLLAAEEGSPPKNLFEITNHLNHGIERVTDPGERLRGSVLNLEAGRKAKASVAFEQARHYLDVALSLLPDDCWQNHYEHTISLYVETIEVRYLSADFREMDRLAGEALKQRVTLLDRIRIYEIRIIAHSTMKRQMKALEIGNEILRPLGIDIPLRPTKSRIIFEFLRIQPLLFRRKPESLSELPDNTDPYRLSAMRIMAHMLSAAFLGNPDLFPILIFRQIEYSIKYGNSDISSVAYSSYGIFLCGIIGDIEKGYAFFRTALRINSARPGNPYGPKACVLGGLFVRHWKEHLRESLPDLLNDYQTGLKVGDHEYAAYAILTHLEHAWFLGNRLEEVEQDMARHSNTIKQLKQENIDYLAIMHQSVLNLLDRDKGRTLLVGTVFNEREMVPFPTSDNYWLFTFSYHYHKLILCYLFQKHEEADEHARGAKKYLDQVVGAFEISLICYFDSLNIIQMLGSRPLQQRWRLHSTLAGNQRRLRKWANHAPANFEHKWYLVEAERHRLAGHTERAEKQYESAIKLAKEQGFGLDEALANELAGQFYLQRDLHHIGRCLLGSALKIYLRCGAAAKAREMEKQYPTLLSKGVEAVTDATFTDSIREEGSRFLDIPSILKAFQLISGEMDFNRLMKKLIGVLLTNAGAQRGCLISTIDGQNYIEVLGTVESEEIQITHEAPLLINKRSDQPISIEIIQYVTRTNEVVVLDNAAKDATFGATPYIRSGNKKSILCIPLNYRGTIIGSIYLENDLSTASFTKQRVRITHILATQAAISMAKARAINDLKTTERQLYQSREQLRELAKYQQEIRENEQKRISMEIHDELGSMLTRIRMELDLLENTAAQKRPISEDDIAAISQLTKRAIQSSRRIATALRPKILDQFGVLTALEWQARQFQNHFSVSIDEKSQNIRMDEAREVMLFRIGQEAITNIARHADASRVILSLQSTVDRIVMSLSDDGCGLPDLDMDNLRTMGIRGMKERATQLGGELRFTKMAEGGTRVILEFPKQPTDRVENRS